MSELNKYSRGKIYTIRCRTDDSLVFVGSTSQQYLCQRFACHKNNCKIGKSGSLYKQELVLVFIHPSQFMMVMGILIEVPNVFELRRMEAHISKIFNIPIQNILQEH